MFNAKLIHLLNCPVANTPGSGMCVARNQRMVTLVGSHHVNDRFAMILDAGGAFQLLHLGSIHGR